MASDASNSSSAMNTYCNNVLSIFDGSGKDSALFLISHLCHNTLKCLHQIDTHPFTPKDDNNNFTNHCVKTLLYTQYSKLTYATILNGLQRQVFMKLS